MRETPLQQRLYDSGFTTLVPLIPHGADISPHSPSLANRSPDQIGKIPGALRDDGWVGLAGWTERGDAQEAELAEWAAWGAETGLRCRDVVAVDIDVTDEALADLVELEVITHLGFGPVRVGRAPKRLIVFRLAEPGALPTKLALPFRDWNGVTHVVELLGARQQFAVSGIHPTTGKPYTWDQPLDEVGLDGLTTVSVAELETFLSAVAEAVAVYDCEIGRVRRSGDGTARSPEELRTADLGLLQAAADAIPNGEEVSRDFFVAMAHAVWGAASGSEDGLAVFLSWAERYEGQDMEHAEQVYRTVRESRTGIQWLLDTAHGHGFDTAPEDFDVDREQYRTGSGADAWTGEVPAGPEGEDAPASAGEEDGDKGVFASWVYVNGLKRFVHVEDGRMWDKEQWSDAHRHLADDKRTAANRFLDHCPASCFVDEVDYVPGVSQRIWHCPSRNRRVLNTWSPGPAHAAWQAGRVTRDEDVRPWLDLAEHLFPEQREREILFDWFASLLQRPGVKPNWHPLICSEMKGIGKDSLLVPLVRGLGSNVTTIDTEALEQPWTHWAEGRQLVVVSELQRLSRRGPTSRLVSYMATPPDTITINRKNLPQYEISNRFGMVMFSNSADAASIERHDRRFFVLRSPAGRLPEAQYAALYRWFDAGGCEAVVGWLLARDVSAFNPKGTAPDTEAKEDMRRAALPTSEGTLLEAIDDEEGPFAADVVSVAQVRDWLRQHVNYLPNPRQVGRELQAVGAEFLTRLRDDDGTRQRFYAVRRAETWQRLLEEQGSKAFKATVQRHQARVADAVSGGVAGGGSSARDDFTG